MQDTVLRAVETGWDLDPALKDVDKVGRMRRVSIKQKACLDMVYGEMQKNSHGKSESGEIVSSL